MQQDKFKVGEFSEIFQGAFWYSNTHNVQLVGKKKKLPPEVAFMRFLRIFLENQKEQADTQCTNFRCPLLNPTTH